MRWPGGLPVVTGRDLIVLADTVPADDGGHRAVPLWLRVSKHLWRLLDAVSAPGTAEDAVMTGVLEETAARLLQAAGVRVTAVDIESAGEDVQELRPDTAAARVELATAAGTRHVQVSGPGRGRAILTAAVPEPAAFAFLSQEIYAEDYHDRTVTFRGDLRTTDVADRAGLVLRVTTNRPAPRQPPGQDPANHFALATGTRDWTRHEVTAQVPPDANYIFFGVFLNGRGQIELRNSQLEPHPVGQQPAS